MYGEILPTTQIEFPFLIIVCAFGYVGYKKVNYNIGRYMFSKQSHALNVTSQERCSKINVVMSRSNVPKYLKNMQWNGSLKYMSAF